MKVNTIDELKTLALLCSETLELPNKTKIDEMEIITNILFLEDTLLPIVVSYSNLISNNMFETDIINIKVIKSEEGVCNCILEEYEEDEESDGDNGNISKTLIVLTMMDVFKYIFNLKKDMKINLTELIEIWKEKLSEFPEFQEINQKYIKEELNPFNIEHNLIQKTLKR